jgi:uncharacterized protein (TIGR03382 family)
VQRLPKSPFVTAAALLLLWVAPEPAVAADGPTTAESSDAEADADESTPRGMFTDHFDGPDLVTARWREYVSDAQADRISIDHDRLRLTLGARPQKRGGPVAARISSERRWLLDGDFDVQVDYRLVTSPPVGAKGEITCELLVRPPGSDTETGVNDRLVLARRAAPGAVAYAMEWSTGGVVDNRQETTTDIEGTLRIKREGSKATFMVTRGDEWRELASADIAWAKAPVLVQLGVSRLHAEGEVEAELDDFQVNRGKLVPWVATPAAAVAKASSRGCSATTPGAAMLLGLALLRLALRFRSRLF